jgi:hypothetical protein
VANDTRHSQSRRSGRVAGRHSGSAHRNSRRDRSCFVFIAAIITHLRGRDYSFGLAIVFLLLALAALVLRVASL